MRTLESYIKKYGKTEGPKMYRRLQREAALASGHARHKKAIAKKQSNPNALFGHYQSPQVT